MTQWTISFLNAWWLDVCLCLADGKLMPKEQRCITLCPNSQSCNSWPSKERTVGSGLFLGYVILTFYTFPLFPSLWMSLPLCSSMTCCYLYLYIYSSMWFVPVISLCVFVLQGMVDPGEQVSFTLQREFSEEALNSLAVPVSERAKIYARITKLFKSSGFQVCRWHARPCLLTHFSPWAPPGGSSKYLCFSFRSLKVMWTIRGTLTMLGWKQLLWTSMMSQVSKNSKIVVSILLKRIGYAVVFQTLSLCGYETSMFCRAMSCRCYCRQQCERAAAAGWRWRRTRPVGWCWLVLPALRESFQFPGAGCQREKSPLVTKDKRLYLDVTMKETFRALLPSVYTCMKNVLNPNLIWKPYMKLP